jgi:hypothetical protein
VPRWFAVAVLLSSLAADSAWLEVQQTAPPRTVDLVVIVSVDDAEARPLRRANVFLQGSPIESARGAVTDDEGRAVFRELPPGSYTLFADRVGYVRTFHGGRTPGRGPGVPLAVVAGARMEPVRLRMLRGGAIGGTVRSASGAPIRGQIVELTAIRTIEGVRRAVAPEQRGSGVFTGDIHRTTDDRGVYRFSGLAPGQYLVSAPALGAPSQAVQLIGEGEQRWADAVVAARRSGAPVPPVPDASPARRSATMYYPGVADPADAQVIELGVAEEREGIDIVMQWLPTSRVSGRLLDDQGRPQPNVAISIRRARPDPFSLFEATSPTSGGRSQADGTFTIENVLPGEYKLIVRAMLRDGAMPPAARSGAFSVPEVLALSGASSAGVTHWAEQTISVSGQDVSGVTLALQRAMVVTGRLVYDAATRAQPSGLAGMPIALVPLPDVAVLPEQARSMMTRGTIRGRVDAAGEFAIAGVPPGRYRVDAGGGLLEAEEAIVVAAGGWLVRSVMAGGRDVADVPLEIRPGEDVTTVVVTFTDRPASLTGRVFDGAERPVSRYPIVVFSTNRSHWTPGSRRVRLVQPASNGAFEAAGLPAGEYFVVAVAAADGNDLYDVVFLDQLAASAFRIALAEGERKVQDLRLK